MGLIVSAYDDTYDLDFLREALETLDPRLERLLQNAKEASDSEELHEASVRRDHLCGLAFVACQNYLSATISLFKLERDRALDLGPIHVRSGIPMAALANSLANFWKHRSEWPSPPPQEKRAVQHLKALGLDPGAQFPLELALRELVHPHPPRFRALLPFLQRWRDAAREASGR